MLKMSETELRVPWCKSLKYMFTTKSSLRWWYVMI